MSFDGGPFFDGPSLLRRDVDGAGRAQLLYVLPESPQILADGRHFFIGTVPFANNQPWQDVFSIEVLWETNRALETPPRARREEV